MSNPTVGGSLQVQLHRMEASVEGGTRQLTRETFFDVLRAACHFSARHTIHTNMEGKISRSRRHVGAAIEDALRIMFQEITDGASSDSDATDVSSTP